MRVGFIGCGRHAITSLYPALAPAGLTLVATCARHLDRAQAAAAQFGASGAFDNADRMLEEVKLDAVLVSVSPEQYAPLVELCLEAGLPVFTEKPGAASAEEARRLTEASHRAGKPLMVGYMKRFAYAYRLAKDLLADEEFGPPTLGSFTFVVGPGAFGSLRAYLVDNPVHPLDLARFLLGELSDLKAYVTRAGQEHAVAVLARAASGAVVTFQLSTTASWFQRNEAVEIFGTGHSIYVDNLDTVVHRPPQRPERIWRPNYTAPFKINTTGVTMGFVTELEHFREVVTEGTECESDISSAAATLALVEEICELVGA